VWEGGKNNIFTKGKAKLRDRKKRTKIRIIKFDIKKVFLDDKNNFPFSVV